MKKVSRLSAVLWIGAIFCLGTPLLAEPRTHQSNSLPAEIDRTGIDDDRLTQNRVAPPVPPLPTTIPEPTSPAMDGIVGLNPELSDNLGIGHLRPKDIAFLEQADWQSSPYLRANWLQAAAIPIYVEPEGNHWGWIVNGWLVPNGQTPIAVGRDAAFLMRQTYNALFSFPVIQMREDGWFQLQYTPAGTAWAHIDHLSLGQLELTVELWEDRFLEMGQVYFRSHGLSQPLRSEPASGEEIIGLIGPESFIEPIAFDGDWMQVRVTQPTDGCIFLPGSRTREGWMRWRDLESDSLVWYPPAGC